MPYARFVTLWIPALHGQAMGEEENNFIDILSGRHRDLSLTVTLLPRLICELTIITTVWKNNYFDRTSRFRPHTLPALPVNEFVDCWQKVENIALEPGTLFPTSTQYPFPTVSDTRAGISATFPKLRKISIVVNSFVDLESSFTGEAAVCPPTSRCRLVEAAGETTWPGRQPRKHWLDTIREEIELLRVPVQAIPLSVQNFEVYVGRQGRKQWKKHPYGS